MTSRFGVLSFDHRGFCIGIFDRMPDNTVKLIEHKLSTSASIDDYTTFISPYRDDIANPLAVVYANKSVAYSQLKAVLNAKKSVSYQLSGVPNDGIRFRQTSNTIDTADALTLLSMRLNDGDILMSAINAKHFCSEIQRATINDFSISVSMLLILVQNWNSVQLIGVRQMPVKLPFVGGFW